MDIQLDFPSSFFVRVYGSDIPLDFPVSLSVSHRAIENMIELRIFSPYMPLRDQIREEESLEFVPDFVALRYLVKKTGLMPDDCLILLVSLANLLRLCDLHNYEEVYVGPFKFVKGASRWTLASY